MKRRHLVIIFVLFAGLISLPYLLAWGMAGNEHVFAGMLANPVDGQSYLTKMRLGWNGQILFQLTYSPQNGEAHPLFLFYTILGWLSHQLNIPLIISFHLARLISAAFLFVTLVTLVQKTISRPYQVKTLLLLVIGSGMGWLVLPFSGSGLPIDFYVAETYPFLSSYSNPHFPLGTALLLWILMESLEYRGTKETILIFVLGLDRKSVV